MLGLYLHIPWCPSRCIYCDFNTYVEDDHQLKAAYQAALLQEIRQTAEALTRPALDTIFIGGGTPTTLPPAQLAELVDTVAANFALSPQAEITTEANPGTLDRSYLRDLRQAGINRLSLGVQSFQDEELRFLSRLHDVASVYRTVRQARQAGFDNLSLDLIFNLPQQTVTDWQFNLQHALELAPEHLSIYSLIIEVGTPLHRQRQQGLVSQPDDDIAAEMYALTIDMLAEAGYVQYEISNWARPDTVAHSLAEWSTPRLASAHNLIYWRNQPYVGLGAGAYGTLNGSRWANVKHPRQYIQRLATGQGLGAAQDNKTVETIDPPTAMSEQMLLGLRLVREGVNAVDFMARFGVSLEDYFAAAIEYGLRYQLLEWLTTPTGRRLRLTQSGRFLANRVMLQFMPDT